jgi:hypothetical protein
MLRDTKLYPTPENCQRIDAGPQQALPWLSYVTELLDGLTADERATATVDADIEIRYLRDVPQWEIDQRKLAIVTATLDGLQPGDGLSADALKALRAKLADV